MLTIKLARRGKRNQPFFRLIIQEKSKNPSSNFLEDLGFYNPLTKQINFKKERIKYWLEHGAQPTDSVHNLLINQGVIKGEKRKVTKKKIKKTDQVAEIKTVAKPEETAEVKAETSAGNKK